MIECDELRCACDVQCSDGNIRNQSESEAHSESESLTSATVTNQKACSYNSHSYILHFMIHKRSARQIITINK